MVESSGKTLEKEMANHFSIQCLENLLNNMNKLKGMILKDELPRSVDVQYATGEEQRNSSRGDEKAEPKCNSQLWMYLVVKVNSDDVKNNIA